MKLNRYGMEIKQWLKNEYPIKYQDAFENATENEIKKIEEIIGYCNGKYVL